MIRSLPVTFCMALVSCHRDEAAQTSTPDAGSQISTQTIASGINLLPAALISSQHLRPSLVVSGGDLYFGDASERPVKMMPISGGPITPLAYRARAPARMAVRGRDVLWSDGPRLFQTSIDTRSTTLLASGNLDLTPALLADATGVYWVRTGASLDCSPACVHRIERFAAGTSTVLAEVRQDIVGFAQDATTLYWSERGIGPVAAGCNCGSTIRSVPKAGGAIALLADGTLNGLFPPPPPPVIGAGWTPSGDIVVNDASVVFSDAGHILTVPRGGGAVSIGATLDAGSARPRALVADAATAWWINANSAWTASLVGGTPAVLATGLAAPVGLFLGGTGLLVVDQGAFSGCCLAVGAGTILQIPLGGGPLAVVAAGLDAPTSTAIDSGSLYWTEEWRLGTMPVGGGARATVASGIGASLPRLAANHEALYVLDGPYVKKLPLAGGPLERAATAYTRIGDSSVVFDDFDVDDTNAFVARNNLGSGAVVSVTPLSGGATILLSGPPAFAPYDCTHRVMARAGRAYWSSASPHDPIGCAVYTAPSGGGAALLLVDGTIRDFTVDGSDVFFSTAALHVVDSTGAHQVGTDTINRVSVTGGPVSQLPSEGFPSIVAADSAHVYWISLLGNVYAVSRAGGDRARALAIESFLEFPDISDSIVAAGGDVYWTNVFKGTISRATIR